MLDKMTKSLGYPEVGDEKHLVYGSCGHFIWLKS